jgi:hypothetical protein
MEAQNNEKKQKKMKQVPLLVFETLFVRGLSSFACALYVLVTFFWSPNCGPSGALSK